MSELLVYVEKEERIRKLLRSYMIFLYESKKIRVVDLDWDLEFCKKYHNAINQVFSELEKGKGE